MIVYSTVIFNDQPVEVDGSMLAAFVGDECRGVSTISDGPSGKSFQLNVASNEVSEEGVTFKIYDASSGKVYGVEQVVDFKADSAVGRIDDSFVMSATEGVSLVLKAGWNIIGVGDNYSAPSNSALISAIWGWGSDGRYFKVLGSVGPSWHKKGRLIAGHGYWVFCESKTGMTIELK